jgi:hypothetical protein
MVCWGSSGDHLGLLVDDLVTVLGCGASEKLGDGVGEVSGGRGCVLALRHLLQILQQG